ncbi:MAG: ArsO family NAD(P)H-dependent flavin-containing monooxygenase [Fulvivirga sp.]|nr:ArsO family NAD(P)H-dependent flavin-containing monooxygenase [Fulvivirga sp.]
MTNKKFDVVVIGGGQSGLACGYYLRRTDLNYIILDDQENAGGAWLQTWDSLKLFSPAEHSSLPGWLMPKDVEEYPTKKHVIKYLQAYEKRYNLPIKRPVCVRSVTKNGHKFIILTDHEELEAKTVISATGTWKKPFIPDYEGIESFNGLQLHSAHYKSPKQIEGNKVLIVGGGNSGAQILAEVSKSHLTTWVTLKDPKFLPDDVDGRYLFEFATRQYKARLAGEKIEPVGTLGDVVMVESVKEARSRDDLKAVRPFRALYKKGVIWENGTKERFDAIIWCTGFKSALDHLSDFQEKGRIPTQGTRARNVKGLWLVGYGNWTGYASATLIGVGRTARQTIKEVNEYLGDQ